MVVQNGGFAPKSVLLVGGFGEAYDAGFLSDGFAVTDDWVGDVDFEVSGVELSEILKTDLDVEITATGDDMLTGGLVLFNDD